MHHVGDAVEQPLTVALGEQLGVAHAVDPPVARQDHGADHQRTGPRATTDLVDADDDVVAELPQLPLDRARRRPLLRAQRAGQTAPAHHRRTIAGSPASTVPTDQKPAADEPVGDARVDRGQQAAGRLRVEAQRLDRRRRRRVEVTGDVLAVAGVAAGAHAALGRLQRPGIGHEPVAVDDESDAAALGDLPAVAGEAVARSRR